MHLDRHDCLELGHMPDVGQGGRLDGRHVLYLVLRRQTVEGRVWIEVRVPRRPLAVTGWVPRAALGSFHRVFTRIVVDLGRLRATLYSRGRPVWTSVVGVGAPATPTPRGRFYVREKLIGYSGSFYGTAALGTSSYSSLSEWPRGGVVGIHGTDEPQLLPGRVSHGCIRVPDGPMARLAALAPLGTPILIR
jgi:L,D-transpeptidase catalytic domain